MPRNIEMRERVGGVFNHADSLLYPKTHISMVDGLLVNGKFSLSLLPDALKSSLKPIGIGAGVNTIDLLAEIDAFLTNNGLDTPSRMGAYFIMGSAKNITVSVGHTVHGDDGLSGLWYSSGSTMELETQDWLMYKQYNTTTSLHEWVIINNTHGLASSGKAGLMSGADKDKLDGIAANANNYSHPSYTTRSVDTDGIVVLDTFTSDAQGHVTGIGTRSLPNATTSLPGVMSAADKSKLDGIAVGANNYSLPTASASVLGGVKVGSGLSITSGVLANSSPNATHTGDVTGSEALTIANGVVTNVKLAQMNSGYLKGNNSGSFGSVSDLSAEDVRQMLNVENGANNYSHPTQTAKSEDLTSVETIDSISFDTSGHIATLTKQVIRSGSTAVTGLLQLATGAELTTALNASKATTPVGVKTMIDFFAGMKRYADITAANTASHPDGAIALVTVA